jgi:hypothetical protein
MFEQLNGDYAPNKDVHNNTAELEKHLTEKKRQRDLLR